MFKKLQHLIFSSLVLGTLFVACASAATGKEACDKLKSCNINSSGVSCDQGKTGDCEACIKDLSCDEIRAGKCNAKCPGASSK
jgi:hypothetical protein